MFGNNKRDEKIRRLEERIKDLDSRNNQLNRHIWDLVTILRVEGSLKNYGPEDTGMIYSTAEPAICGCPVSWTGSISFGGQGRIVYHTDKCPLKKTYPDTNAPSIGVNNGSSQT